jgi:hypothetical protein
MKADAPNVDNIVATGSDNHYYFLTTGLPKISPLHMRRNRERFLQKIRWSKLIVCDQAKKKAAHLMMRRPKHV